MVNQCGDLQNESADLLPCMCGGKAQPFVDYTKQRKSLGLKIECLKCGMNTGVYVHDSRAIEVWNDIQSVNAKLEKCLAFLETLVGRDKANGKDLTQMWISTYTKSEGVAFVHSFVANEARELLEELESE